MIYYYGIGHIYLLMTGKRDWASRITSRVFGSRLGRVPETQHKKITVSNLIL